MMEHFKEYAEDFNTATLPHEKYYNYDKWEMEEYQRQKEKAQKAAAGGSKGGSSRSDEFMHREEMKRREDEKRNAEMSYTMSQMSKEKISEMRNQDLLRHEMTQAYKVGDTAKTDKITKRLAPDKPKAAVAHPWAGK
jgi:hypothetical protein